MAASITLTLLVVNLAVGVTSVKASQRLKSFSGISGPAAIFDDPKEMVEKVREHLPRKTVDYRRIAKR